MRNHPSSAMVGQTYRRRRRLCDLQVSGFSYGVCNSKEHNQENVSGTGRSCKLDEAVASCGISYHRWICHYDYWLASASRAGRHFDRQSEFSTEALRKVRSLSEFSTEANLSHLSFWATNYKVTRKLLLFSGHASIQRLATILLAKKLNADLVPEHLCCCPHFLNNCSIFCLSCCFPSSFFSISFHNVTLSLSLYIYIYIYLRL